MTHQDTDLAFFLETCSEVWIWKKAQIGSNVISRRTSLLETLPCVSRKRTYVILGMPVYTQLFGALARTAHLQDLLGRRLETKRNQRISFGCLPDISLTAFFADRRAYLSSSGISRALMCGCTMMSNLKFPKAP